MATLLLKIGERELQKCTFNRKEALFTPSEQWPLDISPAARETILSVVNLQNCTRSHMDRTGRQIRCSRLNGLFAPRAVTPNTTYMKVTLCSNDSYWRDLHHDFWDGEDAAVSSVLLGNSVPWISLRMSVNRCEKRPSDTATVIQTMSFNVPPARSRDF